MEKTLSNFITYLHGQVGVSCYVWGGQGEVCSDELIVTKEKNGPGSASTVAKNTKRALNFYHKLLSEGVENPKMYDCSGLGMYFLQDLTGYYTSDKSANSMMKTCTMINKTQVKKGCWVFRCESDGTASHIGYMVTDTELIEAQGRDVGVTFHAYIASKWDKAGVPEAFKDEIGEIIPSTADFKVTRVLKEVLFNFQRGEDVKQLQTALSIRGYLGQLEIDGIFGRRTKNAVIAYQKANNLKADGEAGKNTITALGGTWAPPYFFKITRIIKVTIPLTKGEDVKAVQDCLIAMGYNLKNDGIYGAKTRTAVINFQKNEKLKADGIVGEKTTRALGGVWNG